MSASWEHGSSVRQILGDRIALDCGGEGEAALIFLHGGGAGRGDWRRQLEHFAARFQVLACDLPGHGESSTPGSEENASIEHLAAVTVDLMKQLARPRNILIGHSMGCWVALEAYRQRPSAVTGLVLIECTRFPEGAAREQLLQQIREAGGKNVLLAQYRNMFLPGTASEQVTACLERVEALSGPFIEKLILSTIEWDRAHMAETLHSFQPPLLLLQSTYVDAQGTRRSLCEPRESPWLQFGASHARHVDVEIIEHAGHFPHLDEPEIVNAAIECFARRILPPQASSGP